MVDLEINAVVIPGLSWHPNQTAYREGFGDRIPQGKEKKSLRMGQINVLKDNV